MPNPLSELQIRKMLNALDKAEADRAAPTTFVCDGCSDRLEKRFMRRCRGMKLCPECRESARDYFGR